MTLFLQTAMLHAAITGVFYQAYVPTPNAGLFNVMVFTDMGKTAVDLELYDMSGNFYADPTYRHGLYGIADVYVLCFDQLNRTSFENIENLVRPYGSSHSHLIAIAGSVVGRHARPLFHLEADNRCGNQKGLGAVWHTLCSQFCAAPGVS